MAEPGQRIEAIVGEPVTVRLGAGPPTGYAWHARELAGIRVLDAPSTPGDPGQGRAPGDPVEEQLVLIAETPGTHHVVLELVRPWEPDKPIREQVLEIVVRG